MNNLMMNNECDIGRKIKTILLKHDETGEIMMTKMEYKFYDICEKKRK